ncbi:fumarate hydratase, putative [Plasmodium chabaudi chabaudi]|uniref:Fumarate hydratase, putative n=1 Tax=Plasmodium chabaudi chabaudi TaxID=31271 RepID=A0A4V0K7P0_PLACU|nr:fumarate hydratase, putative [Plasmodium chabaudi chabaudi]VTZ68492.1 fumarate hydratase, putative [Plasmodium chabaudi chabaudi]|eukprot:XP_016653836.1 fumarate hydratase, putative [Plasmodium chabaudi chabaudi]
MVAYQKVRRFKKVPSLFSYTICTNKFMGIHGKNHISNINKINKLNINTLNNFLDIFEFEEKGNDGIEYRRLDELSKYIEVIKLDNNKINKDSKYYDINYENENEFFDENGNLKIKNDCEKENNKNVMKEYIHVPPFVLTKLCEYALKEILFFLNKKHLKQLQNILIDKESSDNDKFVAMTLIKNAIISSHQHLPGCQDTGTAIILGKKDEEILTTYEHKYLTLGVYNAYKKNNFRYSQLSPINMFDEVNTKNNLPCQIEIYSNIKKNDHLNYPIKKNPKYELIFIAKGGGSANKTFLFQQTKSILNEDKLYEFLLDKIKEIGTSACPPYHLAIVIGGLSPEMNLKTVKLASCRYLDDLPTEGNIYGKAFRDIKSEKIILDKSQSLGIGAQFGGKYFVHDVRVIRLPRHSASCPIGIGVSCSADRQIKCIINKDGVFVEKLEHEPIKYLPEVTYDNLKNGINNKSSGPNIIYENSNEHSNEHSNGVAVDLNQPMENILKLISNYPVSTLLILSGKLIVARDTAHKRIVDNFINENIPIPEYFKKHPIYYAGPAKTPNNYASGSFGPTTAGRMDAYAEVLMKNNASLISLAKGNRSLAVRNACKKYNGFYLGSIGGPGAILAKNNILNVQVIDFPELGMEAVHLIDVVDFPAFIIIDNKGNDFYNKWIPS